MLYAYEPFDLMVKDIVELMDENDKLKLETAKLREYAHSLEVANIDPTDAYVVEVRAENARLKEFASRLMEYVDPASHQDTCNIECLAYTRCCGKSTCAFPDWALEKAKELGIDVDDG